MRQLQYRTIVLCQWLRLAGCRRVIKATPAVDRHKGTSLVYNTDRYVICMLYSLEEVSLVAVTETGLSLLGHPMALFH